jgi:hypothetical protein
MLHVAPKRDHEYPTGLHTSYKNGKSTLRSVTPVLLKKSQPSNRNSM